MKLDPAVVIYLGHKKQDYTIGMNFGQKICQRDGKMKVEERSLYGEEANEIASFKMVDDEREILLQLFEQKMELPFEEEGRKMTDDVCKNKPKFFQGKNSSFSKNAKLGKSKSGENCQGVQRTKLDEAKCVPNYPKPKNKDMKLKPILVDPSQQKEKKDLLDAGKKKVSIVAKPCSYYRRFMQSNDICDNYLEWTCQNQSLRKSAAERVVRKITMEQKILEERCITKKNALSDYATEDESYASVSPFSPDKTTNGAVMKKTSVKLIPIHINIK